MVTMMWHLAGLATAAADAQPIGDFAGLWRSQTMYQDWMEPPHDAGWLRPRSQWPAVPQWRWPGQFNRTDLFTDEMCTDGLLGGWNDGTPGLRPKSNPPDPSQDVAFRTVDGSLAFRWALLDSRLDDMVANGVKPLIMLGRVPWSLSVGWPAAVSQCTYGNAAPPSNFTEWGQLVGAVCSHILTRYGHAVKGWRYRVWTEPNQPDSFTGSVTDYEKMYDFAAAAIRRVLGTSARIGPANFCRYCSVSSKSSGWQDPRYTPNTHEPEYWSGVKGLMDHFARGTNWATGTIGSPVDFLAMSNYGCYGGAPTNKLGYGPSATAASGELLTGFRSQLGVGGEHATLELHEFGALVNRHWRVSSEPGAFGAAWTLANWQAALSSGVSRAFHWGFEDSTLGVDLLESAAWAMAMAEGAVADATSAPAFALSPALQDGSKPLPPNTTVTAFAVRGAGPEEELYVFVASLNAAKAAVPTLALQLDIQRSLLPATLPGLRIAEYRMNSTASPFDVALAELTRQNATSAIPLLQWNDGEVYGMGQMATAAGVAALAPNRTAFEALQVKSLLPQPFDGTTAAMPSNGGVRLSFTMVTPCALVLQLGRKVPTSF